MLSSGCLCRMQEVLEENIDFGGDFCETLRDGILLSRLVNKIQPGLIRRIHQRNIPLLHCENIQMYLKACQKLGMQEADLFDVGDLYERKYLPQVCGLGVGFFLK